MTRQKKFRAQRNGRCDVLRRKGWHSAYLLVGFDLLHHMKRVELAFEMYLLPPAQDQSHYCSRMVQPRSQAS